MAYDYTDLNAGLTREEIMFKKAVREFAQKEIRPVAEALDKIHDPQEAAESPLLEGALKKIREMGYHAAFIPEAFGGLGLSPTEGHIFTEEMGAASGGITVLNGVDAFPALLSLLSMDEGLIKEIVPAFCADTNRKISGCWGITEPDRGSDCIGALDLDITGVHFDLTAEKDGGEYVLNGQKSAWVSNGPGATHAALFLCLDRSMDMKGSGMAIVPLDLPGVSKGKALDKMGQRELPQGEIFFDNVRIPERYIVVTPETYPVFYESVLAMANALMGAAFTGVARAAFEEALTYAKGRVQGGTVICNHQNVQQKLFQMFMKVESARQMSRAAWIYNAVTQPPRLEYSITSKVYCTQAALEVTSEAIQIFGGYGLCKEYPVEKLYRDARASLIEDGINEMLGFEAARLILKRYK
jgi:alkylation response protein AidB-like acyl-CoA dehydrogenase